MQSQPMMLREGDFARGMSAIAGNADASFTQGDFATGMRARPRSLAIGSFAVGQVRTGTVVVRGNFATGQCRDSHSVRASHTRPYRHEHGQSAMAAPAMQAGRS
jgi:hypothetical protein